MFQMVPVGFMQAPEFAVYSGSMTQNAAVTIEIDVLWDITGSPKQGLCAVEIDADFFFWFHLKSVSNHWVGLFHMKHFDALFLSPTFSGATRGRHYIHLASWCTWTLGGSQWCLSCEHMCSATQSGAILSCNVRKGFVCGRKFNLITLGNGTPQIWGIHENSHDQATTFTGAPARPP